MRPCFAPPITATIGESHPISWKDHRANFSTGVARFSDGSFGFGGDFDLPSARGSLRIRGGGARRRLTLIAGPLTWRSRGSRRPASVHWQRDSGHVGRLVPRQEHSGPGVFLRVSHTAERSL